jgi:hypothetical protein
VLKKTHQNIANFGLKIRIAYVVVMSFSSAVVNAQVSGFPDFFEKHIQVEATDTQGGPKVQTQFDYMVEDTLIARSSVKLNKDGFEDHMAVGLVQNFDDASATVTYNIHRFNYSDKDDETDDVIIDFRYLSLHVQHRFDNIEQISTIGLPFDLFSAQVNLSYDQISQQDTEDSLDVYRVSSEINGLKISATLKDFGDETVTDVSTEYRPSKSWLMKFIFFEDGVDTLRQLHGEYAFEDYRVSGHYESQIDEWDQPHITGSIGFAKDTKLAGFELGLEYDDKIENPSLFFNIKSEFIF